MKSWFGSGKPRAKRVSLDFHYGARTSVWSEIVARSHLIVAAIGTASLLGLAGTAIWLALPSDADGRLVSPAEAGQRIEASAEPEAAEPAKTAVSVAQAAPAEQPAAKPAEPAPDKQAAVPQADPAQAQPAVVAAPAQLPEPQAAEAEVEPLDSTDPRWVDPAKAAALAKMPGGPAKPAGTPDANGAAAVLNAYTGSDNAAADDATAAIPTPKPEVDEAAKPAEKKAAGKPVRTLRSVTMRARPNDRGSPLTTVPGKTEVQVVSCDRWCEVIYKGKRGFVFRRFLVNNGR